MYSFPSVFDEFFSDWNTGSMPSRSKVPAVNVKESEKEYTLEMAVPGFTKEDFNIELDNDQLTVSTEQKSENETSEENYTRKEFSYYAFKRSFTLPKDMIDAEKVDAKYENGVLHVNIPKRSAAEVKTSKSISVK